MTLKAVFLSVISLVLFNLGMGIQVAVASVVGTKHDLSSTTNANGEVCVFCHTPHNANNSNGPLWNRNIDNTAAFQPYTSSTMDTVCATIPSPMSLACLSCHDDAISGGAVNVSNTHNLQNPPNSTGDTTGDPNCLSCHPGAGSKPGEWWQIGPDLTDDHPISMTYPTALEDPEFNTPPDPQKGWNDVKLFAGKVECASCHDPHDATNVPFLRKTIDGSALCYACHIK